MLAKIKDHLGKITTVLSVVATALLLPTVLTSLEGQLTEAGIVSLVEYLLLLAAGILLFLPCFSDVQKKIPIATALFYGALAFVQVYRALDGGGLASFAMAALYIAVLVLAFLPPYKKAFRMLSLIAIAFFLSSALGGGAVNLSMLLTSLVLGANDCFDTEKE